jgi:hypothetical protein
MGDSALISAENFAKERTSYWSERLPLLERFVRAANLSVDRLSPPITSTVPAERHAFIAELAFELLKSGLNLKTDSSETVRATTRAETIEVVRHRIARLANLSESEIPDPDPNEWDEIRKLHGRLRRFLRERQPDEILVAPELSGCGIIDRAAADLLLRRHLANHAGFARSVQSAEMLLYEVKVVNRTFRASDFRQLIVYAALMAADGTAPQRVGLVNPRLGIYFESTADELTMDTAGMPAEELLQQIIFDISATEVSL